MARKEYKIGYWVPCYRQNLTIQLAYQMLRDTMVLSAAGHGVHHWFNDSTDLTAARNEALERAMADGHDYLLMQDSDIYCPKGDMSPLAELLKTMQKTGATMVSSVCGLRRIELSKVEWNVKPLAKGEYEADCFGTGMVLIDVAKVKEIAEQYDGPWFARTYSDARHSQQDIGHDIFFCRVLTGHGHKLWVNADIPTVHVYSDHVHLCHWT